MPKAHLWAKAKTSPSAGASNMGVPQHRSSKKVGMGSMAKMGKMKKSKGY